MKKSFYICVISVILSALLLLGSCSSMKIKAIELSSGYERSTNDRGEVNDELCSVVSGFYMELFSKTLEQTEEGESLLLSPLSAVLCLGLIANGAAGDTLSELESLIGMDRNTLNRFAYAYTNSLYGGNDIKLGIANSVWYRDNGFAVDGDFLQMCADWYAAEQYKASFDSSTAKDINTWVKNKTDGMIEHIINPDDLNGSVMYLINAIIFDAKWQNEYEKSDVREEKFTSYSGNKADVQMLCSNESVYLQLPNGQGFAKNYKGGKYSFIGLLPDEGVDVYELALSIDGEAWTDMWKNKKSAVISAKLPEFKIEDDLPLKEILMSMGLCSMFGGAADLTSLGASDIGHLYLSDIKQKAVIEVDKNGTKAAAVTWADIKAESADIISPNIINIYLDRPFVFAVADNSTGLPIFVGIYTGE